jgi:hypothetical protein
VKGAVVAVLLQLACGCGFQAVAVDSGVGDLGAGDLGPADLGPPLSIVQSVPDAGRLWAVWGAAPDDVHAVGEDGILHFDGRRWSPAQVPSSGVLTGVWGAAHDDVLAVGAAAAATGHGVVLHYDGQRWSVEAELPDALVGVWGIGAERFATTSASALYQKVNGTWTRTQTFPSNPSLPGGQPASPWGVGGNSASSLAVAGGIDTLFFWDGASWRSLFQAYDGLVYRPVWGAPAQAPALYVGSNYFGVWLVTDLATVQPDEIHFEHDPSLAESYIYGIWGVSSERVIMVGDGGRIMTFDGLTNKVIDSPTAEGLSGVWGSALDDVWIVGDEQTIVHARFTF